MSILGEVFLEEQEGCSVWGAFAICGLSHEPRVTRCLVLGLSEAHCVKEVLEFWGPAG